MERQWLSGITSPDWLIAVVLEVWGEEPCGIATEAVEAVVQSKMRKRLMAALAQIDGENLG